MDKKMPQIRVVRIHTDKGGYVWATLQGKCGVQAIDKRTAVETIKAAYPGDYDVVDVATNIPKKEKEVSKEA